MRKARGARLAGAVLLAIVVSVCLDARAVDIVQKKLSPEGAISHNFLRLGDHEMQLTGDGVDVSEGNVCNTEKTLWALNYHVVSNWDAFDLVLEGKDQAILLVAGVDNYIDAALRKKKIIPDFPYDHQYTNAVSIDGTVITCSFRGYAAHTGEHEGQFKVLVTEVKDGVTLEPFAMNVPMPSPKGNRRHLPPGVAPRKSQEQAPTKLADASLSSGTAIATIVKRPFHVNAEEPSDQNFLVTGDWRVLLPLHTQTSENLCNAEKTLWALPYSQNQSSDAFDVLARTKSGGFVVMPSLTCDRLTAWKIVARAPGEFDVNVKPVSVESDVISGQIDGKGYKDSAMAGEEYHAQFKVRIKENGPYVDLEPVPADSSEQTPAPLPSQE